MQNPRNHRLNSHRRPPPPRLRHRFICASCRRCFFAPRSDTKFCSDACRQRNFRAQRANVAIHKSDDRDRRIDSDASLHTFCKSLGYYPMSGSTERMRVLRQRRKSGLILLAIEAEEDLLVNKVLIEAQLLHPSLADDQAQITRATQDLIGNRHGENTMTIAQRVAQVSSNIETASRSRDFADLCRALALGQGNFERALSYAENSSARVQTILKTSPGVDQPPLPLWALPDIAAFQPLAQGFSATLQNVAAFDGILTDAIIAPLTEIFGVVVTDATAGAVAEGAAKPVSSLVVNSGTLQEKKAAGLVVVSADLLRFGRGALTLLENSLRVGIRPQRIHFYLDDARGNDAGWIERRFVSRSPHSDGGRRIRRKLPLSFGCQSSGGAATFSRINDNWRGGFPGMTPMAERWPAASSSTSLIISPMMHYCSMRLRSSQTAILLKSRIGRGMAGNERQSRTCGQ